MLAAGGCTETRSFERSMAEVRITSRLQAQRISQAQRLVTLMAR
jgi:hypothetical protein